MGRAAQTTGGPGDEQVATHSKHVALVLTPVAADVLSTDAVALTEPLCWAIRAAAGTNPGRQPFCAHALHADDGPTALVVLRTARGGSFRIHRHVCIRRDPVLVTIQNAGPDAITRGGIVCDDVWPLAVEQLQDDGSNTGQIAYSDPFDVNAPAGAGLWTASGSRSVAADF